MNSLERRLRDTILGCPTAPFYERQVQCAIEEAAERLSLPVRQDRFGNLYVSYRKGRARALAFSAHMDHPGFEVLDTGPPVTARLLGGVAAGMLHQAPVAFHSSQRSSGATTRGHISRVLPIKPTAPGEPRPEVRVEIDIEGQISPGDFGYFDFPLEIHDDLLYAKAHDNVLSCVLILVTLARLRKLDADANVLGIFTRAEEVGFVGAGGVLRSHHLSSTRPLVVLECSKARGEVRMGHGPVLRVGDRMTCFDPHMDLWLGERAAALAKRTPQFQYQRALMTGGTCEASLFMLHGYRVGALAMPLGNYHNMTDEGHVGPEFVHLGDFENALLLLSELALNPPAATLARQRRAELDRHIRRHLPRLLKSRV